MLFNSSVDLLISSRLPFYSDSFRFCVIDLDILLPYQYLLTKKLRVYRAPIACVAGGIRGHEKLEIPPAQKLHILSSPGSWVPEHSDWSER
jgi:hypothetical protein